MALGFFRKRQKMIFIIMVVLMVSFLIGYQGFQMLFQKSPAKTVIGEARDFDVTLGMLRDAKSDLQMLQWFAPGFRQNTFAGLALYALNYNAKDEAERSLLYTLLLKQAGEGDYAVTDSEVDHLIMQMNSNGMDFDAFALHMRQNQGIPVKQLRGVLARWLLLCKACQADIVVIPPSREELAQMFRDIHEKIDLQIITIPAGEFLKGTSEPTKEQVTELFEANRNRPAGTFAGLDSFDFGYLIPAKVKLAYLFVSQKAVLHSSIPADSEITDYINANQAKLTKTTGKGDASKTVPMNYAEKRAAAIEALQPKLAQVKFMEVVEQIRQEISKMDADQAKPESIYPEIVRKMTLPGGDLLSRKVPVLAMDKQPLDKVVEMLAQAASPRISAICFPYGRHGKVKIAPDLKITLNAANITVGEALAKIAKQIPDMPKLTWGMCEGIDNVLFPVGGVRMFPVTASTTGLETLKQIHDDPLLGKCGSQQPPATLGQLAMRVSAIQPTSKFTVGQEGPALQVWDMDNGGAILWRVLDAKASQSPETVTDALRKQIVRDWKLTQAFATAKTKAQAVKNAADMQAYIKANKSKTVDTGLLARLSITQGTYQPTRLPAMKFKAPAVDAKVVKDAFTELAPKNLSADYAKESKNVMILPLPCEEYVLVARRIGFEPAEKKQFEEQKSRFIQSSNQQQYELGILMWFNSKNVKTRIGYKEKKANAEE